MSISRKLAQRLQFLARVTRKECQHLTSTDQRLFDQPFTLERAKQLETDLDLSERVEAFVGRFGRLQDTLSDKVLPMLLRALSETPAAIIDNLDRAERLGLLDSVDEWLATRQLRNQMVHEYVEDLSVLTSALQAGHDFVPVLLAVADKLIAEIDLRLQAGRP